MTGATPAAPAIRLGLRQNLPQFALLVVVNAFVGAMAGLERSIVPAIANRHGWTVRHVVDTHIHADHVSRVRLLAEASGAALRLPDSVVCTSRLHQSTTPTRWRSAARC